MASNYACDIISRTIEPNGLQLSENDELNGSFIVAEASTYILSEARDNTPSFCPDQRNRPNGNKEYYVDHIFAERKNKKGEVLGYYVKWEDC